MLDDLRTERSGLRWHERAWSEKEGPSGITKAARERRGSALSLDGNCARANTALFRERGASERAAMRRLARTGRLCFSRSSSPISRTIRTMLER